MGNLATYYHRVSGAQSMYSLDGDQAVARYPNEWAAQPWSDAAAQAAEAAQAADTASRAAELEAAARAREAAALASDEAAVLAAMTLLQEHRPRALSDEGRRLLAAEADRIRDRDARHMAGAAAHQEAAMVRAFPPTKAKDRTA